METGTGKTDREIARAQMRWLMGLGKTVRPLALLAVAAPLVSGLLLIGQAYLLAQVLHEAIMGHTPRVALVPSLLAVGGLMTVRAMLTFLGENAGGRAAEKIKLGLREGLFAQILQKPSSWTAARPSGALAGMIVDQAETLEGFFARYMPAIIAAAFLPLAFAVAVLPVDVTVGLLFLLTAPLIPVFMALIGLGAEAASKRHVQALTRLSGLFADRLRGIVTLKLFGRAEAEAELIEEASETLRKRTLRVLKIAFLSSAVLEFFAALGVAGVALYVGLTYLGLLDLRASPLTLQAGLFCLLMAPEVYLPLRQLAVHYHDRAAAKAATAEIAALFEGLPDLNVKPVPEALQSVRHHQPGAIVIADVTIRTPDLSRTVLERIDLTVAPGERIAVLGESGIGKSTLLEAIARLRTFSGEITLNGQSLASITEADLRSRIAFIGQRPRLFHGTIAENIRLGHPDANAEEIRKAAVQACVTEFSDALAQGLDTFIGEGGLGLSGGEAHRVALARLFLRDPDIVLLDEPTAHLDRATETRVMSAVNAFSKGRTLVLATHSMTVAAQMDRVVRIAGGSLLPSPRPRNSAASQHKGIA
ncbi:thiol reductant ABC exporter subunit CydD [Microvirga flavescens]|uniref:thiol reductant ABC exporter subunit CydD n=1 Tax=Microvirga flavescens TaxID=2249811 RepID=UPI0018E0727E|nr:thiol reductant ABC exporter subunit CydD [Microvirga flavescens]